MGLSQELRAAIVGCGLIGQKRAKSLAGAGRVAVCCDVVQARAHSLAKQHAGAIAITDWREAVRSPEVDVVIVCTTHNLLAEVAEAAALAGKHVLVEKPGACRAAELDAVRVASERTGARVRFGFNHRYHRAMRKAREIFDSGVLSEPMFVRGRYGHGGRVGYDKEWRAVPAISGGGEAVDQGVHLIDLARWFLGDLHLVGGAAPTYFWDMPVEDNAFLLLETDARRVAFLHASWTEWKNLFSFEVCGKMGKLEITGLGGSYGTERLAHYQMLPEMGPPPTVIYEFPMADDSWEFEFAEFAADIRLGRAPQPGIRDAQEALRIVEDLYARARS